MTKKQNIRWKDQIPKGFSLVENKPDLRSYSSKALYIMYFLLCQSAIKLYTEINVTVFFIYKTHDFEN